MLIKDGDKEYFMLIKHEFWKCLSCGEPQEVTDQDRENQEMFCDRCGYSLEFKDDRFETWEEEY